MDDEINLPFKKGQLVESRSFEKGFRGAWFKCKILDISWKRGRLGNILEYLDFPGEKLKWRSMYHVTHNGDVRDKHKMLLLRPPYPPIYKEEQVPPITKITEVAVVVGDSWKVGDLVDWWTTGCYWSGTITQILDSNKAQMALHPQPLGEGDVYKVEFKDLRPSLDWSPELGWTIPTQEGADRPCARLIKPLNEGREAEGVQRSNGAKSETQAQSLSQNRKDKQERSSSSPRKTETRTLANGRRGEAGTSTASNKQENSDGQPIKRSRVAGDSGADTASAAEVERLGPILHSKRSDTLEAAIMDLEEYLNKVKWLKKVLLTGVSSSSDDERPQWRFSENPK